MNYHCHCSHCRAYAGSDYNAGAAVWRWNVSDSTTVPESIFIDDAPIALIDTIALRKALTSDELAAYGDSLARGVAQYDAIIFLREASKAPFHELLWHTQYHLSRLFELTEQPERAETYAGKWREHKQATSEMVPSNQLRAFLKVSARDDLDALIESRLGAVQEVEAEPIELT